MGEGPGKGRRRAERGQRLTVREANELVDALRATEERVGQLEATVRRFLDSWDEFDGPPLTVEETHAAVVESVEEIRSALAAPSEEPERT